MRRMSGLILALIAVSTLAVLDGIGRNPHGRTAQAGRRQAQLREFTLTAEPVRWEIQPGLVVDGWGYNGQIPGPTLRVTEGDTVRVHLVNHLPEATTIHWHGIDVPNGMDGVPGLSQDAVEPGDSFTYEFTATNPGTRMYHSHTDTDAQMQLGLFGAFIIDPATPEPTHYDREFTYILSEKALDFTPDVALGKGEILHRDAGNGRGGALQPDLFLMNGKAGEAVEPMQIAPGERVRIRLINLGNLVHAMHLHGQSFKVVATDGNVVPEAARLTKDTVNIAPGERYDLAVEGNNPGVWMFHCHINNHAANGMSTVLQYDGYQPISSDAGHGSHGAMAPLPVAGASPAAEHVHESPTPTPTPTPVATPVPGGAASAAGSTPIAVLDNHYTPGRLTIAAGAAVTWTNSGNNFHTVTSYNALWDSGTFDHGKTYTYTFTQPGTYRYYCRQHLLQGMTATITVTPP